MNPAGLLLALTTALGPLSWGQMRVAPVDLAPLTPAPRGLSVNVAPTLAPLAASPALAPTLATALPPPVIPSLKATPAAAAAPASPAFPRAAAAASAFLAAPAPSANAAAQPSLPQKGGHLTLIQSLSAPAPDLSGSAGSAAETARADFEARAQLGGAPAVSAGVTARGAEWKGRELSKDEAVAAFARHMAPAFEEEAVVNAQRLAGRTLSAEERADVAGRTRVIRVTLKRVLFNEFGVMASHPDGVARPDRSIELFAQRGWRDYPDAEAHFRALFAHEHTHRLQFEGDVSRRFGIEAAPVAVELLRGMELVGLDGLRAGRIPFISPNVLTGFDWGRQWAAGKRDNSDVFIHKGALGGAAYALAERTGRRQDAWEFLRRTVSERRPEEPGKVFADIASRQH